MNGLNVKGNYNVLLQNIQAAGSINIVVKVEEEKTQGDKLNIVLNKLLISSLIGPLAEQGDNKAKKILIASDNGWKENVLKSGRVIISSAFIGVVSNRLNKILALDSYKKKDDVLFSEYVSHSYATAKLAVELVNFMLLSKLFEYKIREEVTLNNSQKNVIELYLSSIVQYDASKLGSLQKVLFDAFDQNNLTLPEHFVRPTEDFYNAFNALGDLYENRKEAKGKELAQAELHLAKILTDMLFLTKYTLVSVKAINYEEYRNYLAFYLTEQVNPKENDKIKFEVFEQNPLPSSVIIYCKNIRNGINLFPMAIDYNVISHEASARICFFSMQSLDDNGLSYIDTENDESVEITMPQKELTVDDFMQALVKNYEKDMQAFRMQNILKAFDILKKSFK